MLTSYVLNRCKSWRDLIDVVLDVRDGSKARGFRKGMKQLQAASAAHQNEEVDEILTQLSAAAKEWSSALRPKQLTKKVRITVPIINISTEIDVPDRRLGKTTADRLLVFVHSVLAES